jgi:MFS family permease
MGQIATVSAVTSIIVGLGASALSLRFKAKSLFLWGLVIYAIGIVGYFFAPNFITMMAFAPVVDAGGILAYVMIMALIGEQMPLQRRGWAIGLVTGASFTANFIVPQVSVFIFNLSGWRAVLTWFLLPVTVVSLVLSWLVLQSVKVQPVEKKPEFSKAYKQIFVNKSAMACVFSNLLLYFGLSAVLYFTSFYQIRFGVSVGTAADYYSLASVVAIAASIVGGRLINPVGRKNLYIITAFFSGLTIILMAFTSLGVSVALWIVNASTFAIAVAAISALALEIVPAFRAAMMSVTTSFRYVGSALGPLIGGLVLNLYGNNFQMVFTMFGVGMIVAVPLVAFLTKDPCRGAPTTAP